jgi:NAD(P)-dependent dehydrogenase (short-subunit alcohol dehydrogenase family)
MRTGRTLVITGAAAGMGSVIADRFLTNGDIVIAADTRAEVLASFMAARDAGDRLISVVSDVSKEDDCRRIAEAARGKTGRIDVLVHCAGFFPIRRLEEMSVAEWRTVIDINLTGAFLLTRAVLPLMTTHGWGRIVNFGSGSIFEGVPGQAHYVAAKAGVIGVSRCIARELGEYGITVNVVAPGLTVTEPVKKNFSPELLEVQKKARAIRREEVPEDLVGTTFFLASPDADFVTGQMISVDGGKNMH